MSRSLESRPDGGRVEDLPGALWAEARAAERRLLLIDYDGTLGPFRINPLEARPHPGAAQLLDRIVSAGRTRFAVISGRPVHELRRLLDVGGITLVGEHGWEVWNPGAGLVRHPLPAEGASCPVDVWPLYLGDEWTGEDAFRALEGRDIGIRVGLEERPSHARYRISGPPEVAGFLRRRIGWVEGGGAAATGRQA